MRSILLACAGDVVTRAHGDVKDNIGQPCPNGQMAVLDPEGRAIAMHLYNGLVKVRILLSQYIDRPVCVMLCVHL